MTRIDSSKVKWRVQTKAKTGRWINRGLFETREVARVAAKDLRDGWADGPFSTNGLGFGNVRVIRHVAAVKGKKPVVYGDCLIGGKGGNAELRRGDGTGASRVLKTWRDGKLVRTKP